MRISDWSSDVCSSDLASTARATLPAAARMPPPAALDLEPPPRYNSRSAVAYASRTSLFLLVAGSRLISADRAAPLSGSRRFKRPVRSLQSLSLKGPAELTMGH